MITQAKRQCGLSKWIVITLLLIEEFLSTGLSWNQKAQVVPVINGSRRMKGELGESEFQFKFTGNKLEITIRQLIFAGEAMVFEGSR